MAKRSYIKITGTNAFVAFLIYLYLEIANKSQGTLKILFLSLFIIFSVLALLDTMEGGLKDDTLIGANKLKKIFK